MAEQIGTTAREIREGLKKRLVLIVDGDPARKFLTSILLQRLDYHVATAASAEDALMIMNLVQPQVVLTEIALPSISGIDLLKRLKTNPRTSAIPVIIYTHLQDPAYRGVCFDSGCEGYLVDPIAPEELFTTIQAAAEPTPRHFVRMKTALHIEVGNAGMPGVEVLHGQVSDLSENGMFISMDRPPLIKTVLPFTLRLDDRGKDSVTGEGRVLYSYPGTEGHTRQPGMGIEFTVISDQDRTRLRAFIREQLMSGVAFPVKDRQHQGPGA
jgi:CheY-like chemotaxis protein